MQKIIIGFICGFMVTVNVWAEAAITAGSGINDIQSPPKISAQIGSEQQVVTGLSSAQQLSPLQNSATTSIPPTSTEETIKGLTNRLTETEIKNSGTQTQIAQLSGRITTLEKKISELSKHKHCFSNRFFPLVQQYADKLSNQLGAQLFMAIVAGIVVILLSLLIYLLIPRRKESIADYPQDDSANIDATVNNGDTAAKLNLAHAYIDMGQESKAQSLLYEVLSHGNDDEQAEAKKLLEKIKKIIF